MSSSGFLPQVPAFRPDQEASNVMTSCVVTTHADMNILASISPNSGSIAAFAKWNITAQTRKTTSRRSRKSTQTLSALSPSSPSFFFRVGAPRPLVIDLIGADEEQG